MKCFQVRQLDKGMIVRTWKSLLDYFGKAIYNRNVNFTQVATKLSVCFWAGYSCMRVYF